jgi:hypothetical protein
MLVENRALVEEALKQTVEEPELYFGPALGMPEAEPAIPIALTEHGKVTLLQGQKTSEEESSCQNPLKEYAPYGHDF